MTTCIKNITTKKGLTFTKGNNYKITYSQDGAKIYADQFNFITIKSKVLFKKYFN